ncbi:hypothetical protein RhiirA1_456382 [Rhizophagus irregularis]|uniref:Uncharacterized protein n=2 Tax=Rhizophagus irregularis TaxID=588596 RepID=A0A2N0S0P4_9GLOM|nr:hypothetical protein RhiirA1_456382 [Rhizophagus irregularis]
MTLFASNIINTSISEKQKHILLFNVNQPLELSIEEFDKEWWPFVSNIWTSFSCKNNVNGDSWKVFVCQFKKHNKSSTRKEGIPNEKCRVTKIRPADLCSAKIKVQRYFSEQKVRIERFKDSPDHLHPIEDSKKLKRSEVVRELVMQEAVKNYRPPEIVSAVKEIATETLDLGECVKELRRKEVTNIKYKVRGPLDTHLVGDPKRKLDIREAISFLKNRGYLVERYEIPDLSTYGFIFMHPNHLKNLEQHGWLSLIDSTHKTNRYDYRLFTLYIRNSYGC